MISGSGRNSHLGIGVQGLGFKDEELGCGVTGLVSLRGFGLGIFYWSGSWDSVSCGRGRGGGLGVASGSCAPHQTVHSILDESS